MDAWEVTLLLCLAGASVACGSEAPPGSDTASSSNTTGGSGADDYYPMADGASSVYRHSSKGGWDETVTLTRLSPGVFVEADTANPDGERTEAVLEVDSKGRVFRTSKEVYVDDVLDLSVVYEPGFIRFDPAWLELEVDESVTTTYERTETPAGGPAEPSRPRAHIYTSQGFQTVTILGTTYRDCLVIHRERDYEDVFGEPEDEKKQFYFAPGVGKVWEVNLDSGNTEELVSYSE